MTVAEIFTRRTGITDAETIADYIEMAGAKITAFLALEAGADLSAYVFQQADIAVLLWQQDEATKNASSCIGLESHSFTEGGVSETIKANDGKTILTTYTQAIADVLATLTGSQEGVVRFL